jgi:sugar phosphate isomerase/epimerase
MQILGFSTGALAEGDVSRGVAIVSVLGLEAIELSALRVREVHALEEVASSTDLAAFAYISLHAPTDYAEEQEAEVAERLYDLAARRGWPVVVHPDCIQGAELWKPFGALLCIENMDKRKPVGRTAAELEMWFAEFPDARLCFDIGHAQQVDPSMTEAYRILRRFGDRICQIHLSEVTTSSKHDRISETAIRAFSEVADHLPLGVPVILETPVGGEEARVELMQAERVFEAVLRPA